MEAFAPFSDEGSFLIANSRDVRSTTAFIDGIGRTIQQVVKRGSMQTGSAATDIVTPSVFDQFGREQYMFLPFASTANDGAFKMDPFEQQASFMLQQYGTQAETYFYGQTKFEASPLNRTLENFAPGNNWSGTSGLPLEENRHSNKMKYYVNTNIDSVRIWRVVPGPDFFGNYESSSVYPASELYKTVMVDEHNKQVIEFKDKEGRVILKKVQLTAKNDDGNGKGHTGWLCTYYVYDDVGNLRAVIQPQGVKFLNTPDVSWNLSFNSGVLLGEQCFRYFYDDRKRMVVEKVPGADPTFMFYDARDRLVMSQDGNQRATNKWVVTKYDDLNRPTATYLMEDNVNDAIFHFSNASNSPNYPDMSQYPNSELLTSTGYDSYGGFAIHANLDNSFITGINTNYNAAPFYPQPLVQSFDTKGLVTWVQTKILGTSDQFISSVIIYDDKGRVIQVKTLNQTGGIDYTTNQYSWNGSLLVNIQRQQVVGSNPQTHLIVTKMDYDELWRLTTVKKSVTSSINGVPVTKPEQLIAKHEYDKLGQLKKKTIAPSYDNGVGLETFNYDYNIRGWLLGMNRDYTKDVTAGNYFGFDLGYDKQNNGLIGGALYSKAQFNGNISGTVWKSKGDGEKRKYDFDYDPANRILKADFNQYTSGSFNQVAGINFNMRIGDGIDIESAYDANGNIIRLQQWGLKQLGQSSPIDNLTYTYFPGTNRLQQVSDSYNDKLSVLGDFKYDNAAKTGTDYTYDVNGNLTADNNKKISSIVYNYLNLPQSITTDKGTILYQYDATGNKLKKATVENASAANNNIATTTITTYLGGTVYESKSDNNPQTTDYVDKLQLISHEEGRLRFEPVYTNSVLSSGQFYFDYFVKDHLGNVRMVLTEENRQDVYPAATLEFDQSNISGSAAIVEANYYSIDANNIKEKTEALNLANLPYQNNNGNPPVNNNPNGNPNANSEKVYRLNGNIETTKTGLGITLKVMAGDEVNIFGKSYWKTTGSGVLGTPQSIPILDILNKFVGSNPGALSKGITGNMLNSIPLIPNAISSLFSQQIQTPTQPKAYINWILFDEQFKPVIQGNNSSFSPVGPEGVLTDHRTGSGGILTTDKITKNGYLYVYCSNESQVDVFFDNLQVIHTRGQILEETHYYPFGLTMAGISSKALNGTAENKIKYNSIEQNNDFDLNMYDAFYRNLDPQIGRFWQVDPYSEELESYSPYESMGNNPISNVDPLGDFKTWFGAFVHKVFNGGGKVGQNKLGEWFVRKTETSYSEEGGPTVTATVTYGKGRDRYSSAREAAASDMQVMTDIYIHGENSMYQMYESPQEAGRGALSIGTGVLLPDPILKSTTLAVNLSKLKARISKLMEAARVSDKNGLSRVGRALFKHGGREGSFFPKASGNPTAINKQGEAVLNEILSNPNVEVVNRHHARFGNVSEYKLPNGQGARFSADGKEFFGFIEKGQ